MRGIVCLSLLLLLLAGAAPGDCFRPFDLPSGTKLVSAGAEVEETLPANREPWFCHGLDCPRYTVINHTKGYEARRYEAAKYVYTVVKGHLYEPAVQTGFKRLFDYISGENANGTKIPMTAPVMTLVTPGKDALSESSYGVMFFVPFAFQETAPQPNNSEVILATDKCGVAFVSQFGGFLVDDVTLAVKVKALKADLTANGESFDPSYYLTATYDPPFRVESRHNEVMFAQ